MSHILGRPLAAEEVEFENKVRSWDQVWSIAPATYATKHDSFWQRYPSGPAALSALSTRVAEADRKFKIDPNNDALHFQDIGWTIKRIR